MLLSVSKTKTTAMIIISLMIFSTIAMWTILPVQAAEGPGTSGGPPAGATGYSTVTVVPHLSFRPTTVGKGQTFLVNIWTTPATHAARNHPNYTVVITKPDNTKDVISLPSFKADATAWFEYIADQEGEWKLQFIFPGTYFPGGTLSGGFMGGTANVNPTYYKAVSTEEQILTVQNDIVYSWPETYFPTYDYWTRPVHVENRHWWTIAGNYPGTGYNGHLDDALWNELYPGCNPSWFNGMIPNRLIPWVEAPDSPHILWKRQDNIAGLIGGQAGKYGTSGEPGAPGVIYAGRVYDSYTKPGLGPSTTNSQMFRCYDLRTGEVYWEYPCATVSGGFFFGGSSGLIPNLIEYNAPTQSEVGGAEAAGTWSVNLMRIQGSQLYKWNPWTGATTLNVSISPATSAVFYRQPTKRGELPLALSVVGGRLINWTTSGTGTFASRIQSNTSYIGSLPTLADFESGYGGSVSGITLDSVYVGENITGRNLWTGATIWSARLDEPVYSGYCDLVDHGKIATLTAFGHYVCYDLATGRKLWTSETMDYPWSSAGFGGYSAFSAYGLIIREAYDGVYGINWTNGKIEWKYTAYSGAVYETPYVDAEGRGVMPFYSFGVGGIVADGKFFTWNYEHTESWPVTRGWSLHGIDVFTGEGWSLTGCSTPRAIADGYLIATGWADGYTYIIGKGKSATTVTAPDTEIPLGQSVMIKGSVMDLSPAQSGTPCVSQASMRLQMDYLHMQLPLGGIWENETITGVPVYVYAVDPNNNYKDIGIATTNGYYGTFSIPFTPEVEGTYTIFASFGGDVSYASSGSSTAILVGEAPEPYPTQQPINIPDNTALIYGLLVAVIIAIVLGLVILLLVRKK